MLLVARGSQLSSQHPHGPSGHENSAEKHRKTIEPVADHVARSLAVRDAKDDGGEEREHQRRAEMIESNGQRILFLRGFKVSEFQGFKDAFTR